MGLYMVFRHHEIPIKNIICPGNNAVRLQPVEPVAAGCEGGGQSTSSGALAHGEPQGTS